MSVSSLSNLQLVDVALQVLMYIHGSRNTLNIMILRAFISQMKQKWNANASIKSGSDGVNFFHFFFPPSGPLTIQQWKLPPCVNQTLLLSISFKMFRQPLHRNWQSGLNNARRDVGCSWISQRRHYDQRTGAGKEFRRWERYDVHEVKHTVVCHTADCCRVLDKWLLGDINRSVIRGHLLKYLPSMKEKIWSLLTFH